MIDTGYVYMLFNPVLLRVLEYPVSEIRKSYEEITRSANAPCFSCSQRRSSSVRVTGSTSKSTRIPNDCRLRTDDILTDQLHLTKTISAKEFLAQESEYVLLDVREPDTVTKKAPEK